MRVYTKTGDSGQTSLYGGKRVPKDNIRISAYGSIDELNSVLGVLISYLDDTPKLKEFLIKIQSDLLTIGSYLAGNRGIGLKKAGERIGRMERLIDSLTAKLPPLKNFILPQGCLAASFAHLVRTTVRRAEREVVKLLDDKGSIDKVVLQYLNRLSDLMFMIARFLNKHSGRKDLIWKKYT